jgi:hypothetical protein
MGERRAGNLPRKSPHTKEFTMNSDEDKSGPAIRAAGRSQSGSSSSRSGSHSRSASSRSGKSASGAAADKSAQRRGGQHSHGGNR